MRGRKEGGSRPCNGGAFLAVLGRGVGAAMGYEGSGWERKGFLRVPWPSGCQDMTWDQRCFRNERKNSIVILKLLFDCWVVCLRV